MYIYNKDDKTYTFSSDELNMEKLIKDENTDEKITDNDEENISEPEKEHEKPPKIEVIKGGNDLNISPVSEYIEIEKPKTQKKDNVVIPEDNK